MVCRVRGPRFDPSTSSAGSGFWLGWRKLAMQPTERTLVEAEQRVREAEERLTQQRRILIRMLRHGDMDAVREAKAVLDTLRTVRNLAREHLRLVREASR